MEVYLVEVGGNIRGAYTRYSAAYEHKEYLTNALGRLESDIDIITVKLKMSFKMGGD